eukprot:GHVU01016336.1.p2 GENE.GHVU01016336.1~~GHVU01016336.1.p2  ORF type:complete len:130 (-),score=11.17 GHVU01016336.1:197-586(-)
MRPDVNLLKRERALTRDLGDSPTEASTGTSIMIYDARGERTLPSLTMQDGATLRRETNDDSPPVHAPVGMDAWMHACIAAAVAAWRIAKRLSLRYTHTYTPRTGGGGRTSPWPPSPETSEKQLSFVVIP